MNHHHTVRPDKASSPFNLQNDAAYKQWREAKLRDYPDSATALLVPIHDAYQLSSKEMGQLMHLLNKSNMAIYQCMEPAKSMEKSLVSSLGLQFGLQRLDENLCSDEDSISSLTVVEGGRHKGYIPYSNRALNWHTDGYYNTGEQQIRAMLLHCVQDAVSGGDNALLDHEIVYMLMRDTSPELIKAMMAEEAMTIPSNIEGGEAIRDAQTGPVFSVDSRGNLHMRYTARKRNIEWKQDTATLEAVAFLDDVMASSSPYIFRHHLQPGEGLLCNNVLHTRSGFEDAADHGKRLLYRARYFDRIANTDVIVEGK